MIMEKKTDNKFPMRLSKQELKFIRLYRQLPPEDRQKVLAMAVEMQMDELKEKGEYYTS